jgi:hypothetical protein
MVLEIGKLKNENGQWLIEYLDGHVIELDTEPYPKNCTRFFGFIVKFDQLKRPI